MEYVTLSRHECEITDDSVRILVSAIVDKLPAPQRRKFGALKWQAQINQKEAELLQVGFDAGILNDWLRLANQTPKGTLATLVGLQLLHRHYGLPAVTAALFKVLPLATEKPEKCTVAYLKAVLRNQAAAAKDGSAAAPPIATAAPCPTTPAAAWDAIAARLKQRINRASFNTWVQNVEVLELSHETLRLSVRDNTVKYWLEEYYLHAIGEEAAAVLGRHVTIAIEAADDDEEDDAA